MPVLPMRDLSDGSIGQMSLEEPIDGELIRTE
jgi:hypothetical protein